MKSNIQDLCTHVRVYTVVIVAFTSFGLITTTFVMPCIEVECITKKGPQLRDLFGLVTADIYRTTSIRTETKRKFILGMSDLILDCMPSFVDSNGLKQPKDISDKDGCTEEDDGHKYSPLKCLDENKQYFVGCTSVSYFKLMDLLMKNNNLYDQVTQRDYIKCLYTKVILYCMEGIAEQKCGTEGRDVITRKCGDKSYEILEVLCKGHAEDEEIYRAVLNSMRNLDSYLNV